MKGDWYQTLPAACKDNLVDQPDDEWYGPYRSIRDVDLSASCPLPGNIR